MTGPQLAATAEAWESRSGGWVGHCPSCKMPRGLRIWYSTDMGRLHVRCHAPDACPQDEILKHLGVTIDDLYQRRKTCP